MKISSGTFGQLTLWGGKSPIVSKLISWFLKEEWPNKTHFRWAVSDKMSDMELSIYILPAIVQLTDKGHTVEMWRSETSYTFENTNPDKHRHVAALYRDAFRKASVDDYCLSVEDDNLPFVGALARLAQWASPEIAQIGGVYRIRGSPEYINASTTLSNPDPTQPNNPWTPPLAANISKRVFYTPMMGAGFTLYSGSALRRMAPVTCRVTPIIQGHYHVAGWDDHVGREFARMGYNSISDGSVWIRHYTPEVAAYLKNHNLKQ